MIGNLFFSTCVYFLFFGDAPTILKSFDLALLLGFNVVNAQDSIPKSLSVRFGYLTGRFEVFHLQFPLHELCTARHRNTHHF
jgi:hypothetical protein